MSTPSTSTANMLTMKKGKPNVPANMRGQYKQQQQMNEMKEEMAKQVSLLQRPSQRLLGP